MNSSAETSYWRKCTTCKKPIGFQQKYWICSVSTCNRIRTGLVFCDLKCFDAHVPVLNHRDAGAFERKAPSKQEHEASLQAVAPGSALDQGQAPRSSSASPTHQGSPQGSSQTSVDSDILVVASKVKEYIRSKSGMNTSASVLEVLSQFIRRACDAAIERAKAEGRKTVLDRDF